MTPTATPEATVEEIQQWGRTYQNLYVHYMFSQEWQEAYDKKWSEFEKLEKRRAALGIPSLPWQETVKGQRIRDHESKEKRYCPLPEDLRHSYPLRVYLHQSEDSPDETRRYPWKLALTSWERFRELYTSSNEFRLNLSQSQLASYCLLIDWWNSLYGDRRLLRETQEYMGKKQNEQHTIDPAEPGELEETLSPQTSSSLYHCSCFELFLREFHPMAWEPNMSLVYLQLLQTSRYRAGRLALAQRFSFAAHFPHLQRRTLGFPSVFMNETQWQRQKGPGDHPRYLWDTEKTRTVEFATIPGHPEYICISHTWGRWRKATDGAVIPGVDWSVPENDLFEVRELPEKLKQLASQRRCRYIWMDLFCIPQTEGSQEAQDEIARQASIFRGCRGSIAWLNTIDSWDGVRAALRWFGLKIFQNTHRPLQSELRPVTYTELANAARQAERGAELCSPFDWREHPINWFSSLWTLQEAVLCPDMTLCSSDWTPLEDDWHTSISLHTLMVFLRQAYHFCATDGPIETSFAQPDAYNVALDSYVAERQRPRNFESWPTAARQLMGFRLLTRLDNVLINRSPAAVCTNANVRECSSRNRAPAIMSAIGATDWYRQAAADPPGALVLDMYPLAFLREACARFGASFFDTASNCILVNAESKAWLLKERGRGTMLPFSKRAGWYTDAGGSPETIKVRPRDSRSVRTWEIRGDGSVAMARVDCVFSTSDDVGARRGPRERVRGFVQTAEGTDEYDDVAGYLERFAANGGVVYGVALYEDCYRQHGILLYGLASRNGSASQQPLMKIGNFIAEVWDEVETRSVDWVVL